MLIRRPRDSLQALQRRTRELKQQVRSDCPAGTWAPCGGLDSSKGRDLGRIRIRGAFPNPLTPLRAQRSVTLNMPAPNPDSNPVCAQRLLPKLNFPKTVTFHHCLTHPILIPALTSQSPS